MGETQYLPGARPFVKVFDPTGESEWFDGAIASDGGVFGTYVHGIFDADVWRHSFIDLLRTSAGLSVASERSFFTSERDARLDRLAGHLRKALNLSLIRSWVGQPANSTTRQSSR